MSIIYKIGGFTLDVNKRELFQNGIPVDLNSRAFEILYYLINNRGTVVKKEELLKEIWKDSFVEEANLPVHISAIRRVLREQKGEHRYIKTISGQGYSFISDVQEINYSSQPKESSSFSVVSTQPIYKPKNSLAILPLIFNEAGNENEYLANGITHSLISDLSKSSELRVLSYSAIKEFRDTNLDLQEVGFLLDADKLFTGHIHKYENKLAIEVELINVSDKRCLWGKEYVFDSDDVFKVKKEISRVIAEKLTLKLNFHRNKQEINTEAQKLYYRGKFVLESRMTRGNPVIALETALNLFEKAIDIEPDYAMAYVGIGTAYVALYNLNFKGKLAYIEAKKALQIAKEIDDELSEVYVLQGSIALMFENDLSNANKSFKKAVELNVNNADAYHWRGLTCCFSGKYEDAFRFESKAIALEPSSLRFNGGLMRIFYFSGEFKKSITMAEEILEFNHTSSASYLFLAYNFAHLGFFEKALENLEKCIKLWGAVEHILIKAYIYALFDMREEAMQIVEDVLKNYLPPELDYRDISMVYSVLNEKETAIIYLQKAKENKKLIESFQHDLRYKNLKNHQGFINLFQKD